MRVRAWRSWSAVDGVVVMMEKRRDRLGLGEGEKWEENAEDDDDGQNGEEATGWYAALSGEGIWAMCEAMVDGKAEY